MKNRALLFVITALAVGAFTPSTSRAGPCGDLGKRGDARAQLRVLDCLTAIAASRADKTAALDAEIQRGFREVYEDLCRKPMLTDDVGAWIELYRLWARFYPREEKLAGDTPIAFVNAHHYSVPHWVKRSLETPLGTLVHFDTHSDMEGIPRVDDVRRAVVDLREGRNRDRAWHVLAHAAYRNSMPVTGAVLMANVREVVWAKPGWATDPVEFFRRAFFYARPKDFADARPLEALEAQGGFDAAFRAQITDFFVLHYDPADNEGRHLPRREREVETWLLTDAKTRPHDEHFDPIAEIRLSVLTTDRPAAADAELVRAISGEKFVLDIDLDYFVNQGAGAEQEITDDPASFGERALQRKEDPDSGLTAFRMAHVKAAGYAAERSIIERRIRRFLRTLKALKAAGKTPSIVSIADSANLPFSAREAGQEHSEFVPPHHAYWVHERVTAAIREVFGDGAPSGIGDTPIAAPTPNPPGRTDMPIVAASHSAVDKVRSTLRETLYGAVAWAAGAATTYAKTPLLSAPLLMLHAIARHGPDPWLRRAARAACEVHARMTLEPSVLLYTFRPSRTDVDEMLRRIAFAQRYGGTEWEVSLAAVRHLAKLTGFPHEPDIDAETNPLKPSVALATLGLRRAFAAGQEANLVDVFLGSQATDGGFTIADMPAMTRAMYGLAAVRAILSLLETPELPKPAAEPLWPGAPVSRQTIDDAILRGVLFTLSVIGELPATDIAIDALLSLRAASRLVGVEGASQLATIAGRLLAGRIAVRVPALLATAHEPDQMLAVTELGNALVHFGLDAAAIRETIGARARLLPREKVLGLAEPGPPRDYGGAFRAVARSAILAEMGVPGFSFEAALRAALPLTGRATVSADTAEFIDRFNAVTHVVLTASGHGRVKLDRARYGGEWRFVEAAYEEVLAGRRPDMIASLLEVRRLLGEPERSPRVRDLVWQLLHEQNADGSWGRKTPEDQRLRMTWAVISALGDAVPSAPNTLAQVAAMLVRDRRQEPAAAPEPPAVRPPMTPGAPYKPGMIVGRRGGVVTGRGAAVPPVRTP
jgi:hypothetical protein